MMVKEDFRPHRAEFVQRARRLNSGVSRNGAQHLALRADGGSIYLFALSGRPAASRSR